MPGALSSLPFGAFSLSLKLFLMILYSLDDDGEATLVHVSLGSGKLQPLVSLMATPLMATVEINSTWPLLAL